MAFMFNFVEYGGENAEQFALWFSSTVCDDMVEHEIYFLMQLINHCSRFPSKTFREKADMVIRFTKHIGESDISGMTKFDLRTDPAFAENPLYSVLTEEQKDNTDLGGTACIIDPVNKKISGNTLYQYMEDNNDHIYNVYIMDNEVEMINVICTRFETPSHPEPPVGHGRIIINGTNVFLDYCNAVLFPFNETETVYVMAVEKSRNTKFTIATHLVGEQVQGFFT